MNDTKVTAIIEVGPGEVVVEFHDEGPDGCGRRSFSASWLADNVGPRCDEDGVRSQEFSTDIDRFVARQVREGRTVRIGGAS